MRTPHVIIELGRGVYGGGFQLEYGSRGRREALLVC
uniref:Uncharacterized protein n=1 Tax=Peronospora matthiolae TaxID=2874970 RepID=A0AAV1VGJ6_9STRA